MGAKRPKTRVPAKPGRPARLLEPGIKKAILDTLRVGVPISIACQASGIAEQSYRNWINRGHAEHEARATGYDAEGNAVEPDPDEDPYVEFYLEVIQARSAAAIRNMGIVQAAAQGGQIIENSKKRYKNDDGEWVEEETVKRTAPDWRAATWFMEKSFRSEFGKEATQVEITGAGGGPIEVNLTPAEELAKRLADHLAAGGVSLAALNSANTDDSDVLELGEEDVHEAELVE
jgi:hypothetical protein